MNNNELLIEFFTEDIPARMHKNALLESKKIFEKVLLKYNTIFQSISTYISSRRLVIVVNALEEYTKSISVVKRGPKIGADNQAISGFLKTNNGKLENLKQKDGYYYLSVVNNPQNIKTILENIISEFIKTMQWQTSMRWWINKEQKLSYFWIRPVRSMICIYNHETLHINIPEFGLITSNVTYGHRFLSSGEIIVKDFNDYKEQLKDNFVLLDFSNKREYIKNEMNQKAAEIGLIVQANDNLLNEVAGLVEYPFIHIGKIDDQFMTLPSEVLSTSMRVHQKYFTLMYPDATIAPFFGTVTNVPGMHKGFSTVLSARLSDARFFYNEDTDVTLEAYSHRLSNIVFYEKLGTVAQKLDRLMAIANTIDEHKVIALCKADLVTQMVGEFPELQGIMGSLYAKAQGENDDIALAIRDHYKPQGPNDTLPTSFIGGRISFFDKLDTLVGFTGIGIKPTGSKDPFALRRAAIGILRLICEAQYDVLNGEKLEWYISTLVDAYDEQSIALSKDVINQTLNFLLDRFAIYIYEKWNVKVNEKCTDFRNILKKANGLYNLRQFESFNIIQQAYKRAVGIVGEFNEMVDIIESENQYIKSIINNLNKLETFDDFKNVSDSVLLACDNVLIQDENENTKRTNLSVLKKFIMAIENNFGQLV